MKEIVIIEWCYFPNDYFEEEIQINQSGFDMIIKDGVVNACIDPEFYDSQVNLHDTLHKKLYNRFLGVQLVSHKKFELSELRLSRLHSDGRKDTTVFLKALVMCTSTCKVDFILKDKDGNIVQDSRKDRVSKENQLADLAEKYSSDKVVSSLLKSYQTSVNDPENELIHLFEIRDTLSKFFKGERSARTTLNVHKSDWNRLGQLANDLPLRQGRHRGKSFDLLRDATVNELFEARKIASHFIESYLTYLDSKLNNENFQF